MVFSESTIQIAFLKSPFCKIKLKIFSQISLNPPIEFNEEFTFQSLSYVFLHLFGCIYRVCFKLWDFLPLSTLYLQNNQEKLYFSSQLIKKSKLILGFVLTYTHSASTHTCEHIHFSILVVLNLM